MEKDLPLNTFDLLSDQEKINKQIEELSKRKDAYLENPSSFSVEEVEAFIKDLKEDTIRAKRETETLKNIYNNKN